MNRPKIGNRETLYGDLGCVNSGLVGSLLAPVIRARVRSFHFSPPAFRGIPGSSGSGAVFFKRRCVEGSRLAVGGDGVRCRGCKRALWASPFASAHRTAWFV